MSWHLFLPSQHGANRPPSEMAVETSFYTEETRILRVKFPPSIHRNSPDMFQSLSQV